MSDSLTLEELVGGVSLHGEDGGNAGSGEFFSVNPAIELLCDDCEAKSDGVCQTEVGGVSVHLCPACIDRRQAQQDVHVVSADDLSTPVRSTVPGTTDASAGDDAPLAQPSGMFSHFLVIGGAEMDAVQEHSSNGKSAATDLVPEIVYSYPRPAGDDLKPVASFCYPNGSVPVARVKRSKEAMSAVLIGPDPALLGNGVGGDVVREQPAFPFPALPLAPLTVAFAFALNGGSNGQRWCCCMKRVELVSRPPSFCGGAELTGPPQPEMGDALGGGGSTGPPDTSHYTAGGRTPLTAGDSDSFFITQRCYVLVSELPCFAIHFAVLRMLLNQERLLVLAEFRGELRKPTTLCERCGCRAAAARVALAPHLNVELCKVCTLETQAIAARVKQEEAASGGGASDSDGLENDTGNEGESVEEIEDGRIEEVAVGDNGDQATTESESEPSERWRGRRPSGGGYKGISGHKPRLRGTALSVLAMYEGAQVPQPGQVLSFAVPGELSPRTYALPLTASGLLDSTADQAGEFFLCAAIRHLSLDNFLLLLRAVLLERRVLVVSRDLSALSAVVLSVQALLLPFHWSGLFIPVLPEAMQDFLDAPVPWVVGVPRISGSRGARDCLIFELDLGKVSGGFLDQLPALPEGRKLHGNLREGYDRLRASMMIGASRVGFPGGSAAAADGASFSPLSTTPDQLTRARALLAQVHEWHAWLLAKVRRHFSSIIELSGFLDSQGESGDFAKTSFLAQVSAQNRQYVKMLFGTQHFAHFFYQLTQRQNKWKKDRKTPQPSTMSDGESMIRQVLASSPINNPK